MAIICLESSNLSLKDFLLMRAYCGARKSIKIKSVFARFFVKKNVFTLKTWGRPFVGEHNILLNFKIYFGVLQQLKLMFSLKFELLSNINIKRVLVLVLNCGWLCNIDYHSSIYCKLISAVFGIDCFKIWI